jgi:hypothetical protein
VNWSDLRRWWALLAVAALVLVVGAATVMSDDSITLRPPPIGEDRRAPDESPSGEQSQSAGVIDQATTSPSPLASVKQVPNWLAFVVLAMVGSLILVVVGLLVWALLRSLLSARRRQPFQAEEESGEAVAGRADVLAAIEAGLADLGDTERDPRAAVIACWLRMEEAAAAAGTARKPSDSPADLVDRLLRAHRVSRATLTDLAEVYRVARYAATHIVDDAMRQRAVSALELLRRELRDSPAAGDPDQPPLRLATPGGGR